MPPPLQVDNIFVFIRQVHHVGPRAGSGVVRIDPLSFLAGYRTRRLNQVYLCLSYILACFIVLLFIMAPFYVPGIVSFRCYMFCLLVVLVELSVLAKWLARKTPLRKPNRGEGSSPERQAEECAWFSWFIVLLHCFIMYLCCLLPLRDILSNCYGTI